MIANDQAVGKSQVCPLEKTQNAGRLQQKYYMMETSAPMAATRLNTRAVFREHWV